MSTGLNAARRRRVKEIEEMRNMELRQARETMERAVIMAGIDFGGAVLEIERRLGEHIRSVESGEEDDYLTGSDGGEP